MGFRYAFCTLTLQGVDLAHSVDWLARAGYDGIELVGEADWYPETQQISRIVRDGGLEVSSICALYSDRRDLCSPYPGIRAAAVRYVSRMADWAAELGASVVVVGPSAGFKLTPLATADQEWGWAVESIRAAGERAAEVGVKLGLEPWNRYETYFLNTVGQAVALADAVGLPNVGVHGDTFHMNIEEPVSVAQAYRSLGSRLVHTHVTDSNRGVPGEGHLDFRAILKALEEIGYAGWLCFESQSPPRRETRASPGDTEVLKRIVSQSIDYVRGLEAAPR